MRASATGDRGTSRGTSSEGLSTFYPSFGEAARNGSNFRTFVEVLTTLTGGGSALTFPFALDKRATFQYNVRKHGESLQHWRAIINEGISRDTLTMAGKDEVLYANPYWGDSILLEITHWNHWTGFRAPLY